MKKKSAPFVPTYRRLFNEYKTAIMEHRLPPNARVDSITEMQEKHGISRETAKLVLKLLARERLIIQQLGKGSFVALQGPTKKIWGVILPSFSANMEKLLFHLRYEADKEGRTIVHYIDYNNWQEEIRLVGQMIHDRYEAVIVVPTLDETKTAAFYRRCATSGTVVTLLDHTMAGSYFTYAIQSYDLGVKRAADYLFEKTRGDLAFVKNDTWTGRNMVQELMVETFKELTSEAAPPRNMIAVDNMHIIDMKFMRDHFIGGIFCCDDIDAVRIVGRLKEWGYALPDDIRLVSYGNTDVAKYFTPGITAVDAHAEEMASRTSQIIQNHRAGKDVRFSQYLIEPELVVRGT